MSSLAKVIQEHQHVFRRWTNFQHHLWRRKKFIYEKLALFFFHISHKNVFNTFTYIFVVQRTTRKFNRMKGEKKIQTQYSRY